MTYRIAINGFGRIGRDLVRCLVERDLLGREVEVVAINDLFDTAALGHLLQHDSTFGRLRATVDVDPSGGGITVGGKYISVLRQRDPAFLPWADLDVDLVVESTGKFRSREDAAVHLKSGARKVLISAPGKEVDATIVLGVNGESYDPQLHDVVSAASCTTNCAAPMAQVLHHAFGVEQGFLTTVHAYTNDQVVLDSPHKDLRRARTAATNIIPTSTGAAKAIGLVLPELAGRFGGVALRVPVENGSMTDLTVRVSQAATAQQVNAAFAAAAEGPLRGILRYSEAPLVSRDIIGDPASCVFDAGLTAADGHLVKVFGWYDNEWGYTNRLVDLALLFAGAQE
ncbi:type I glyceraldehyde-3-phosphate dehydrogenase [Dactylosporangium sp. CA-092794]|uniref:type I glyceraldehyde-3-phosphate dehydrogenase n=1 Tax=Dactylosporangium sp. CA-092794 TaxID=3239929 RepID=UPI003D8D15B8